MTAPVVVMLDGPCLAAKNANRQHSFRTLDGDVLAAAALDGASPWRVFWRIALPQRWMALVAAWLAAFAIAAGDLAWAQLVRPAGMDLIQRRVFGLVHSGVEEQVAAISLVNVIAYAALAGSILWLVRRVGPIDPCSHTSLSLCCRSARLPGGRTGIRHDPAKRQPDRVGRQARSRSRGWRRDAADG
jgi:hypothetical protein